jgi:hypothetical protein
MIGRRSTVLIWVVRVAMGWRRRILVRLMLISFRWRGSVMVLIVWVLAIRGLITTFIVVVLLVVLRWWGSIIIWPVLFIALIVGLVPVPVRWARRWLPWLMAALSRVAVAVLLRRVLVVVVVLTRHCGKIKGLSTRAVALTLTFEVS